MLKDINSDYSNAFPTEKDRKMRNRVSQLKLFSYQEKNKLYIISGGKKGNLDEIFGGITNIGLASEYGFFFKKPRRKLFTKRL